MTTTSTTSVGTASASTVGQQAPPASRIPGRNLGQEDFLKLLVAQLSAQDPMNPQKDTEFIAQMAQFSSLEQTRAMQADISGLRSDQRLAQANALIGRTVTLTNANGLPFQGLVTGTVVVDGTPRILVDGLPYELGSVLGVAAPTQPA